MSSMVCSDKHTTPSLRPRLRLQSMASASLAARRDVARARGRPQREQHGHVGNYAGDPGVAFLRRRPAGGWSVVRRLLRNGQGFENKVGYCFLAGVGKVVEPGSHMAGGNLAALLQPLQAKAGLEGTELDHVVQVDDGEVQCRVV